MDIKLGILPLKKDLLNYWIPVAFPWIAIAICLRRRLRILGVAGKNDNGHFFYQLIIAAAIAIPIVISQHYIEIASFDLIEVNTALESEDFPNEKYFHIKSFAVEKKASLSYVTARASGRNNEDLTFYQYYSCPFQNTNFSWYGIDYQKRVSNRISDAKKDSLYGDFQKKSARNFKSYDFQKLEYFEKLSYSDQQDGFLNAITAAEKKTHQKEQVILIPKTENFDERLGNMLPWFLGSFGIGSLLILAMVLIPKIDHRVLSELKANKPLEDDDLRDFLELFNIRGPNQATAILLLLNIVAFIIMTLSGISIFAPTGQELMEVGALRRSEVMDGEYWRLITSVFIHSGLMHLLMNLFALGLAAILLESTVGKTKLILSFLICGIVASCASIYWHESTISVGASGAIFGLYGLILAFTVFNIYSDDTKRLTGTLLLLIGGGSLLLGIFGGIDNAAHLGGLACGTVIGMTFILIEKEKLIHNAAK